MKTPAAVLPLQAIQKLLKSIWGKWNIQAIIVASLGFQGMLEFVAPLRKRTKRSSTHLIIWSVYLLADYFATFGIGLINSSADDLGTESSRIAAFWAPFLLLHLGGPHTITSFDIEDNNLWHRHLLTLMVQVFSVLLVFYRYQIYIDRDLLIPTGIVFLTGIVKYAERTRSLYLASLSRMKKSMLQDSSALRGRGREDEGDNNKKPPGLDEELEIVHRGYKYYQFFKGFIIDHAFIHIEDKVGEVKKFFLTLDHKHAFEVLEVELNFMYDAMFTKMAAVQWMSSFGYAYRFVGHALLLAVALIFFFSHKPNSDDLDISITYLLLGGAIFLDFVALAKLVCSEWTVALMMEEEEEYKAHPPPNNEERNLRNRISGLRRNQRIMKTINALTRWISWRQRWSKEIRQYSLINHSLKRRWGWFDKIANYLGLTERLDAWQYTTTEPVGCRLLERVFNDIKKKAELQQQKEKEKATETKDDQGGGSEVHYKEYDNCVLIWHVATEICYFSTQPAEEEDPNQKICRNISEYLVYFLVMEGKLTSTVPGNIGMRFKDICWEEVRDTREELKAELSSAKLGRKHLLDHINSMTIAKLNDLKDAFTLTNWRNNNNADTCDRERTRWEQLTRKWEDKKREAACKWLLQVFRPKEKPSENPPAETDNPKSILSEAVKLAKHLRSCCNKNPNVENLPPSKLGNNQKEPDVENPLAAEQLSHPNRRPDNDVEGCCSENEFWEILSHVWVGLLLYAASHCRDDVQYLNKGGELLTFVRLLMVHFGLKDAFKDEGGFKLEAELQQVIEDRLQPFLPKIISTFLP